MMPITRTALAAAAVLVSAAPVCADSFSGSGYKAQALLEVCTMADNDSRLLGQAAEVECEQYMLGFADAMREVGATGPDTGVCPPEVNTADEIRWAFMKWVHASYAERRDMPAADAVLATIRDSFKCS